MEQVKIQTSAIYGPTSLYIIMTLCLIYSMYRTEDPLEPRVPRVEADIRMIFSLEWYLGISVHNTFQLLLQSKVKRLRTTHSSLDFYTILVRFLWVSCFIRKQESATMARMIAATPEQRRIFEKQITILSGGSCWPGGWTLGWLGRVNPTV